MRFINHAYYRHKNCLDIDIYVIKVQFRSENYTKMKIHIVDRKHTGFFEMNVKAKILKKDEWLWERIT